MKRIFIPCLRTVEQGVAFFRRRDASLKEDIGFIEILLSVLNYPREFIGVTQLGLRANPTKGLNRMQTASLGKL